MTTEEPSANVRVCGRGRARTKIRRASCGAGQYATAIAQINAMRCLLFSLLYLDPLIVQVQTLYILLYNTYKRVSSTFCNTVLESEILYEAK